MRLNEIRDRPGATKAKKRLGRGLGSGLGKTSGRGTKGQKARSGVAIKGFEGGQMPLHRRLPKRGFKNIFAKDLNEVNLGRVQSAIDAGKLDTKSPITVEALLAAGLIRRVRDGVRLLGHGAIKTKLAFEVTGASGSAIKAVEAQGGTVTVAPSRRPSGKPGGEVKPRAPKPEKAKAGKSEAKPAAKEVEVATPAKELREAKAAKAKKTETKTPRVRPAKKDKSE
jgi:large subunit ribosomal protein L15